MFHVVPHVSQFYVIAMPNNCGASGFNNDQAVVSMWEHFVDICQADPRSSASSRLTSANVFAINNPSNVVNTRTGKSRLPVFVALSLCQRESIHNQF